MMSKTLNELSLYRGLNIVHLNVRSLFNKIDLCRTTLYNANIHVLGISETWLNNTIPTSLMNIPGYTLYRHDRIFLNTVMNQIKKGGGVGVYLSNQMDCTVHQLSDLNSSSENIECQWLELKFANQRNVIICNVYRPPKGNVKQYMEYIENCMEGIDYIRKDQFVIGDMNIDILDTRSPHVKELKEFLSQNGLTNHVKNISRYANTRNCNIINDSGTLDVNISDHIPVFVNRKKAIFICVKDEFTGRSYREYNVDAITEELQ